MRQITLQLKWRSFSRITCILFAVALLSPTTTWAADAGAKRPQATGRKRPKKTPEQRAKEAKDRQASVRAVLKHLGIEAGAAIADIGAGNGPDTWVFADIVGKNGEVFSEEIAAEKTKTLKAEAQKKGLDQVHIITGTPEDPRLPESALDLEYMHFVYHHFAKPVAMLKKLWAALKPGGYLVVVDQRKGTLQDWVPREERGKKHYWIAETTVVRDAREQGFAFVGCLDNLWIAKEPFVLVFQRPTNVAHPDGDPDSPCALVRPLNAEPFLPKDGTYQHPVFIALGEARELMRPILKRTAGTGLEIVLEEWATTKDERPSLPNGVSMPSVLTENGDPKLADQPIDAVFFLDTYHLLFHGKTLLQKLREKMTAAGRIFVLDRKATKPLSRREASHHRQIAIETVKSELDAAGFHFVSTGPSLAPDRFLLIFEKKP